ncbi:DUF3310 domain-containing protein [Acinetobacter pittii]|uniref:DUF3310 domain-containing protein n=1 Tax=Acinetobacter pittii TaxID=48296 RepID=A0A3G6YIT3_ACIPI|nr:DUF3310 domain-containing protein [Acinetobacter pittii]
MSAFDKQEGGDHYKKLAIGPTEYSLANGLDAGQSAIIKYVTRFKDKNGLQDLKKARHTIDLLIEHYYPEDSGDVPLAILEATQNKPESHKLLSQGGFVNDDACARKPTTFLNRNR